MGTEEIPGENREDSERYTKYYSKFFQEIYFYFYYRLRDRVQSEDLTQEVFIKLWQELPQIQGENHARWWLWRVSQNRLSNFCRDSGRVRAVPEGAADYVLEQRAAAVSGIEEWYFQKECLTEVFRYVNGLDLLDQEVFGCWVKKGGWEALAFRYGKSEHALRCRASRLVKKLKEKFRG